MLSSHFKSLKNAQQKQWMWRNILDRVRSWEINYKEIFSSWCNDSHDCSHQLHCENLQIIKKRSLSKSTFLPLQSNPLKTLLSRQVYGIRLQKQFTEYFHFNTYHASLGSGNVRCNDIKSLTYWLNALFFQPASINFFVSLSGFGICKYEWNVKIQ